MDSRCEEMNFRKWKRMDDVQAEWKTLSRSRISTADCEATEVEEMSELNTLDIPQDIICQRDDFTLFFGTS